MLPDFNRLKVFYHVYRRMSISEAAGVLHLTQSAVSQHIQKLESELRTKLFTRLPRKLAPTREGRRLFDLVRPFVDQLDRELDDLKTSRTQPRGLLRVGAPTAFGDSVLPRFIADYRASYPEVRFELMLGHPSLLLPAVRSGDIDLAFADIFSPEHPLELAGLSLVPLVDEELVLVCSTPYYREHVARQTVDEIIGQAAFIAYHPSFPSLRSWFRHHHGMHRIKPRVVLAVESVRAVMTAVENHLGLGVVPAHLVQNGLDQGRLTCIRSAQKELINRIALVQLQNKIPDVTEKTFVRHVETLWRKLQV